MNDTDEALQMANDTIAILVEQRNHAQNSVVNAERELRRASREILSLREEVGKLKGLLEDEGLTEVAEAEFTVPEEGKTSRKKS